MSTETRRQDSEQAPRWKLIGPGLVVAATGVGAADLVATLVAGSKYGYALLWCAVLGCLMKIVLVEGAGRFSLATGRTIYEGWASLGRWTYFYFDPYIVIWGFVYGAAAMAGTGLALHALFPVLGVKAWGILSGFIGLALVWSGRYGLFEKVLGAMVLLMFISMVGAAALTLPNVPELLTGLVPTVPDGAILNVLSVAGGVGGTITLAAYGYWLREKGWVTPRHMRVMRLDNTVADAVTGLFSRNGSPAPGSPWRWRAVRSGSPARRATAAASRRPGSCRPPAPPGRRWTAAAASAAAGRAVPACRSGSAGWTRSRRTPLPRARRRAAPPRTGRRPRARRRSRSPAAPLAR
jgi:hypothetical protein